MSAARSIVLGSLCVLLLAACGDDGGGSPSGVVPDTIGTDGTTEPDAADQETTPQPDTVAGCSTDDECAAALAGQLGPCETAVCMTATGECTRQPKGNGATCDDGNPCTGPDACQNGQCLGNALQCNDDNPCTDDACDAVSGECVHLPNTKPCDDGDLCTDGDVCAEGACGGTTNELCQCEVDADCAPFDDADLCNGVLVCDEAGQCVPDAGSVVTCDASLAGPCETVACEPSTGQCKATPLANGSACDDGNACTEGDACSAGTCKGAPRGCDDGNACTEDSCDPDEGCGYANAAGACDDGDLCTVDDACVDGQCVGEENPSCNCSGDADCAEFEDGNLCNGTLFCDGGECAVDPATVVDCSGEEVGSCETVSCKPATGACVVATAADDAACDDGNACTGGDHCEEGACVGGAISCDDQDPCTADACDPAKGCVHEGLGGGACDDGDPCTSGDLCAAGVCAGAAVEGCECTTDADCEGLEDGDLCNGTLACAGGQCVVDADTVVTCDAAGLDPCVSVACVPETGACVKSTLQDGAACDDANACTRDDACSGGVCKGKPKVCDDGNICTDDACDPDAGCTHAFGDAACDDGSACTEGDQCQGGECLGTPVEGCLCSVDADCAEFEDGDPCNGTLVCAGSKCVVDPDTVVVCEADGPCASSACDPLTGECAVTFADDDKPCDDDDACTTTDTCQGGVCVGTGALACDDGNPCTDDACDPAFGCAHVANTAACDDGNPCTEGDACEAGTCMPGDTQVCAGQCEPRWVLGCGDTDVWGTGLFGATDAVEEYGCNEDAYPGPEYAYTFTAPYDGTLRVTLDDEETLTDVLVVPEEGAGCDPTACVEWGFAAAETQMVAGESYYLVVDGFMDAAGGYRIDVACTPDVETACDDGIDEDQDGQVDCADADCAEAPACGPVTCEPAWTVSCGDTDVWANYYFGHTDAIDTWEGCDNPFSYPGPEYAYTFVATEGGPVTVSLSDETAETDILVVADAGDACLPNQCLGWGLSEVTFVAEAGATYHLVVDGFDGAEGTYALDVSCGGIIPATEATCDDGVDDDLDGLVDCEDPDCFGASEACQAACVPDTDLAASLICPESIDAWNNGDVGSGDVVDSWGCNDFDYSGPEYVYTFVAEAAGPVTVDLAEDGLDLDLLVLEERGLGCNPASCIAWGIEGASFDAEAGATYYLAIDGFEGATGDYTLTFMCGAQ